MNKHHIKLQAGVPLMISRHSNVIYLDYNNAAWGLATNAHPLTHLSISQIFFIMDVYVNKYNRSIGNVYLVMLVPQLELVYTRFQCYEEYIENLSIEHNE